MSSPVQGQVNNFVQPKSISVKVHIDLVSKCLMYLGCIFGVHKISVLNITSKRIIVLLRCYYISLNLILIIVYFKNNVTFISLLFRFIDLLWFALSTFVENLFHKRLYTYFYELNKFDAETRLNKSDQITKRTQIIQMILVLVFFLCFNFVILIHVTNFLSAIFMWATLTFDVLELYFYGHLFTLILQRTKLITKYFKLSCTKPYSDELFYTAYSLKINEPKKKQKENLSSRFYNLQKITYMYNKMIIIHDSLNHATKWQFIILLAAKFANILLLGYSLAIKIINGTYGIKEIYLDVIFIAIQYFSLCLPCIHAGQIHAEVFRLKEILVSRLHGNILGILNIFLDKSSQSSARALLGLLETRNLTFSLFHMFDIDLTLPFKFMALIFTYLIIILQFDKVINS